jgi:hypothetical protein
LLLADKGVNVRNVIASVTPGMTYHIVSHGLWSSHDLLEIILDEHGPADVLLTSWSISAPAIKKVVRLHKDGRIRSLKALFDHRVHVNYPEATQLAEMGIAQLFYSKVHAKSMAIIGDGWAMSIVSSANLTTNRRIERFVISTSIEVALWEKEWIEANMISNE